MGQHLRQRQRWLRKRRRKCFPRFVLNRVSTGRLNPLAWLHFKVVGDAAHPLHHTRVAWLARGRDWPGQFPGFEHFWVVQSVAEVCDHHLGRLCHSVHRIVRPQLVLIAGEARDFEDVLHLNSGSSGLRTVGVYLAVLGTGLFGLALEVSFLGPFVREPPAVGIGELDALDELLGDFQRR